MVRWLFKGVPSSKPIPRKDNLLGHNVNHQGEVGKKAQSPSIYHEIYNNLRYNILNWLKYWNDAHHNTDLYLMEQDPLLSESQLVWWIPPENLQPLWWWEGSPYAQKDIASHVVSQYSIFATRGPRDIISLVIHKVGITSGSYLGKYFRHRVYENQDISW